MSPDLRSALRTLAAALPPETPVPVPAGELRELLDAPVALMGATPAPDFTVEQLGARFGKAPSTIRTWLEAGEFPGAYKFRQREWRVPPAVVETFEAAQRGVRAGIEDPTRSARPRVKAGPVSLNAWENGVG